MPAGDLRAFVRAACFGAAFASLAWALDARALDPSRTPAQYVTRTWGQTADGLPQNYVPAIAQTKDGYLWLATQEGIVRFDGVRFVTESKTDHPALRTNDVAALIADEGNGLWIGTHGGGVSHWVGGKITTYLSKDGLGHDVVQALLRAKDGALWVGTRGGGASRLEGGKFTTLRAKDGLAGDSVVAIEQTPDGAIWLGTEEGLSRYADGHITTIKDGLSDPSVAALLADPDGTLWIGTLLGLDRWQAGAITTFHGAGGAVHALHRDRQGSLWVAAQEGLRRIVAGGAVGEITPYGTMTRLDGDGVKKFEAATLLEDHEGNLWAGLESDGLLELEDGKVTTFGSGFVWAPYRDSRENLWLGQGPGLSLLQGDDVRTYPGFANLSVRGMTEGHDGVLWLATTERGLVPFRDGKPGEAVFGGQITALYADSRGAIWFGTNLGAGRFDDGRVQTFSEADGVPRAAVRGFAEARDGAMWMGTADGVLRFKDGKFEHIGIDGSLSLDTTDCLYVDGDDLWIGTFGSGLHLLRGGKIGGVTTRNGLFNDVVFSIVDDQMGSLWMTCNRGIFHAKKQDLADVAMGARERLESVALDTSDGMKASECNGGDPGGLRTPDGMLWFSTTNGVVRVDPAHMRKNVVVPPVLVEEVRVNQAPASAQALAALPADSRTFEIAYTALSFTAPERVRFKYRLEGFDKDWVDAGPRRVAYYTNLAPGSYRFRVIAANDDGVWNETGASASFLLRPHFYQTWPFYLACALGLVLIGAGSVRVRLLALRQRARELETKVEQRTHELAAAKTRLEGAFKALAEKDERLHEDLLQAKAFQERILPRLPSGGAIRFRAVYRPADLVGGDVYDVCELADGHFRVFVADTTGHGVQASLRTMVLKTEYERVKTTLEGPSRVLAELNRKLAIVYPGLEMRCSACCFDVIAEADGATLRYANAAHPPLLRVSGDKVEEILSGGTFLGIMPEASFKEKEVHLGPEDRIVAYTDGLCEQEDDAGNAFGVERMEELLASKPRDAEEVVRDLDAALTVFTKGAPFADDMVVVCVELAGERRSMVSAVDVKEYGT